MELESNGLIVRMLLSAFDKTSAVSPQRQRDRKSWRDSDTEHLSKDVSWETSCRNNDDLFVSCVKGEYIVYTLIVGQEVERKKKNLV